MTARATLAPLVAAAAASCALVAAALATAPEARPHRTSAAWSYAGLMERIPGARVTLRDRRIRIARELVICSGDGRAVVRAGTRRWKHFTCTQTLFDRNGVDRDITFRVHVTSRRQFVVTNVRWGPH